MDTKQAVHESSGSTVPSGSDGEIGEDFVDYLAQRLGVGRSTACLELGAWLQRYARSVRPGLKKAMRGAAPTAPSAASPHGPR